MEIYYATTNEGKVASLQRHMPAGVTVNQVPIEIPEPRSDDIEEIAKIKAKYAYDLLRRPIVALDAGFSIPSLNGFPRAFVNFALETIGIEGIVKLVEDKDRTCYFDSCLVYKDAKEERYFHARERGTVAEAPRGMRKKYHWSDLARIYIPEGYDRTLAELTKSEHDAWSKRPDKQSSAKEFAYWVEHNLLEP